MGLSAVSWLLLLQATEASVIGTVRDGASHRPLVGATVILGDLDRAAATDAKGRYRFDRVPAGPHHLSVRSIGFHPRTLHALVPREDELEIDVSLERAAVQLRPLEARAPIAVRGVEETTAVSSDREASIAAIRNHPLLAEPDVLQALGGGHVAIAPEAPSGLHVRGGAADHTGYLLDGVPVLSPYHAAGVFGAWNPDAIARLQLDASAPTPAGPDVLSGVISATTRVPGSTLRIQSGLSNTQARMTVDGPLGGRAGFLVSWRSGFPGVLAPRAERSYLTGETGDWLAKLERATLGGRLRLLGYDSSNEITAVSDGGRTDSAGRNQFEWRSRSLGAEWDRSFSGLTSRVVGWRASSAAASAWGGGRAPTALTSVRRDLGLLGSITGRSQTAIGTLGFRIQSSQTSYRLTSDSTDLTLAASTPAVTVFGEHSQQLGDRLRLEASLSATGVAGDLYLGPRAVARWRASDRLTVSGSYARLHQSAQSLRNAESVVGAIFPADLYVSAGSGVPVATSDQEVLAVDFRPRPGARLGIQAYRRRLDGLVLVAPRSAEPFGTGSFEIGSGRAAGVALEGSLTGARAGLVGTYGWQRVSWRYGVSSYRPDHGAQHSIDAGLIVFPSGTFSVRLGLSGAFGRRATPVLGGFEWEACNLLDRGCEFVGTPRADPAALGGLSLPPYLRADLGFRKHWHVRVRGRDAEVAAFGTITNLLGRRNILTFAADPLDGTRTGIDMRPRAPLVVGLDWRF